VSCEFSVKLGIFSEIHYEITHLPKNWVGWRHKMIELSVNELYMYLLYSLRCSCGLLDRLTDSLGICGIDCCCHANHVYNSNKWSKNLDERLHREGQIFHMGQCNVTLTWVEHCKPPTVLRH